MAFHGHDTYGMGIANVWEAVRLGIRTVDAAAGGLGGCPFAPGAAGNMATEDVVYLLNGQGIKTGIALDPLLDAVAFCANTMGSCGCRRSCRRSWTTASISRPIMSRGGRRPSAGRKRKPSVLPSASFSKAGGSAPPCFVVP